MTASSRIPTRQHPGSSVDYQPAATLRVALRRFAAFTETTTRKNKLTPKTYELLLFIQAADDTGTPATVTSLRAPLQTTQGAVTQLVERAARAHLITRTTAPADGRISHLHLTATGHKRLRNAFEALGPEREHLSENHPTTVLAACASQVAPNVATPLG